MTDAGDSLEVYMFFESPSAPPGTSAAIPMEPKTKEKKERRQESSHGREGEEKVNHLL